MPLFARLLLVVTTTSCLIGCSIVQEIQDNKATAIVPSEACLEVLRSNCSATQQQLLDELLQTLEIHGVGDQKKQYPGNPPAFEALPKDESGLINWVKTFNEGLIKPRSSLTDKEENIQEGFYENIIFMQVKVHIMADVAFPHGMHTYWLNCDSCHPKPFKEVNGSNNITMKEILDGKWCGKCHGKVAFNPAVYPNCRRCHALPKQPM